MVHNYTGKRTKETERERPRGREENGEKEVGGLRDRWKLGVVQRRDEAVCAGLALPNTTAGEGVVCC